METEAKLNKARHPFWKEVSLNLGADFQLIPLNDARKQTENVHSCMQFYFIEKKTKRFLRLGVKIPSALTDVGMVQFTTTMAYADNLK